MKGLIVLGLSSLLLVGCGLRSEPQEAAKSPMVKQGQESPADQKKVRKAIEELKDGKVLDGIKALDEAIKSDPENVQAYILLGQTYMHSNEYDRAVDSFRAALRVAPDQGEIYYMLAIANGLRGRKDLAVNNAEKALLLFQQDRDGENFKRALVLLQGLSQE